MAKVSVIMAAYNGIATVGKAIDSLQNQTMKDFELVVVDDQSTDGTYAFLQAAASKDARIKVFRTPRNLGPAGAGRIAIGNASGEWITILDSDDWYQSGRLDGLITAATSLKADMVIDNLLIFDHSLGKIVKQTYYGPKNGIAPLTPASLFRLDNPLRRDSIGYCKPLMRNSFLREHNINYWGKYRCNEDFTLLAEIVLCGASTFIIPEAYYVYVHRISPSTRKISPSSHMSDDTALLIASACDALLAKYGINMSGESRHELARRKKIFLTSRVAGAQTSLFRQGHVNKAMRLFIKHPSLFGYRAAGMRKRIETALHIAS